MICDLWFGFINQMNLICDFKSYKSNHMVFNLWFRFIIQFFCDLVQHCPCCTCGQFKLPNLARVGGELTASQSSIFRTEAREVMDFPRDAVAIIWRFWFDNQFRIFLERHLWIRNLRTVRFVCTGDLGWRWNTDASDWMPRLVSSFTTNMKPWT